MLRLCGKFPRPLKEVWVILRIDIEQQAVRIISNVLSNVLSPKDLVNFIQANFKKRECVFFTKDSKAT